MTTILLSSKKSFFLLPAIIFNFFFSFPCRIIVFTALRINKLKRLPVSCISTFACRIMLFHPLANIFSNASIIRIIPTLRYINIPGIISHHLFRSLNTSPARSFEKIFATRKYLRRDRPVGSLILACSDVRTDFCCSAGITTPPLFTYKSS